MRLPYLPILSVLSLATIGTAGCSQPTPQQREAQQIRDAADAQADAIEANADDAAARLEAEAAAMLEKAGQGGGYDSQRANLYADAKRADADLLRRQADAKARAVRDAGQARASALLAQ